MATVVRSDQPIKVIGEGFEPRVLAAGEAFTFESHKLSVDLAPLDELAPAPVTDDVHSPGNRPNGTMSAVIAPKMPKSSGELVQLPVEGQPNSVIERAAADIGQATQGGGPDANPEDGFKTPGPQPENAGSTGAPQSAGATGDTDARGAPRPREESATSGDRPRAGAKKSSR